MSVITAEQALKRIADLEKIYDNANRRERELRAAMQRLIDGHGADDECIRISRSEWYRFRRALDPAFVGAYERPADSVSTVKGEENG